MTNDVLDAMRGVADPAADAVVAALFAEGEVEAVNDLWQTLVENDDVPDERLPPIVRSFLTETAALPDWADPVLIERGQRFFEQHALSLVLAATCAALPSTYAAADGVQVLYLNSRFLTDTRRRIPETAQMILDVMSPGGLTPSGRGIRTSQKVRLMHAAIRHLLDGSGQWDDAWGRPINQEDLAATLAAFAYTKVEAIRRLGVKVSRAEAEAYLHAWIVVGHLLGIRRELLPRNRTEAAGLVAAIQRRHFRASEGGQALTGALVQYLEEITPGTRYDGLPIALTRFFVGPETAALLGLPATDPRSRLLLAPMRLTFFIGSRLATFSFLARFAVNRFSRALLGGMVKTPRGGNRGGLRIPDHMLKHVET